MCAIYTITKSFNFQNTSEVGTLLEMKKLRQRGVNLLGKMSQLVGVGGCTQIWAAFVKVSGHSSSLNNIDTLVLA